jgi:hypothetical protein
VLIVGGAVKNVSEDILQVLQLDGSTLTNLSGSIAGAAPASRRGHSITLLDDRLYVFGGHSAKGDEVRTGQMQNSFTPALANRDWAKTHIPPIKAWLGGYTPYSVLTPFCV